MTSETGNVRRPKTRNRRFFKWGMGFVPTFSRDEAACEGGFTLIEIVLAIMIVAILLGIAIPAMVGMNDERQARKPVEELAKLVLEVRSRAMEEGVPHQIVFDHKGFYATRYFHPYRNQQDFHTHLAELSKPVVITEIVRTEIAQTEVQRQGIAQDGGTALPEVPLAETEPPKDERYVRKYAFPADSRPSLHMWGDLEWEKVSPQTFRRWVFQPSGVINPVKFRIEFGKENFFEVHFDPLTGEVMREKSYTQEKRNDEDA